jgi:hypothetical protein
MLFFLLWNEFQVQMSLPFDMIYLSYNTRRVIPLICYTFPHISTILILSVF